MNEKFLFAESGRYTVVELNVGRVILTLEVHY